MQKQTGAVFVVAQDGQQASAFIRYTRLPVTGVRVITPSMGCNILKGVYAPDVFVFGTPPGSLLEEVRAMVHHAKGTVYEVIDDRVAPPGRYPVHLDTVTTIVETCRRYRRG